MRRALQLIYQDILEFHQRALQFFSRKSAHPSSRLEPSQLTKSASVWRQVFRALWKDFDTRFKGILDNLRRHKHGIESLASLLHFKRYAGDTVKVLDELQRLEQAQMTANNYLGNILLDRERERYFTVQQWILGEQCIAGGTNSLDHEAACEVRKEHQGTGTWILKHNKILHWKDTDFPKYPILWLNGIPGAGESLRMMQ